MSVTGYGYASASLFRHILRHECRHRAFFSKKYFAADRGRDAHAPRGFSCAFSAQNATDAEVFCRLFIEASSHEGIRHKAPRLRSGASGEDNMLNKKIKKAMYKKNNNDIAGGDIDLGKESVVEEPSTFSEEKKSLPKGVKIVGAIIKVILAILLRRR